MSTEIKPSEERVEAAAKVMASFADYWGHMTDTLREKYRERARAVLEAADAAGAQQAAPSGEAVPVAWMLPRDGDDCAVFREPQDFIRHPGHPTFGWTPLYTHPAPAPSAVPAGYTLCQALELLDEATSYTSCETWSPSLTDEINSFVVNTRAMLSAAPPSQPPSAANEQKGGLNCPACGTDRTKAPCPKGHSAALTGDCPMVGKATGGAAPGNEEKKHG